MEKYQQIVKRFRGMVTNDPNGSSGTRPTRVVAWDSEEHDLDKNEDLAKLYIRTITVIDPVGKRGQGGVVESNMAPSNKCGKIKELVPTRVSITLVHW